MPALNEVPWMEYWKASPQNPSGLSAKDIEDEIRWQKAALEIDAAEGNVVPSRVRSSQGRTVNMDYIHTLSKRQFRNTHMPALT